MTEKEFKNIEEMAALHAKLLEPVCKELEDKLDELIKKYDLPSYMLPLVVADISARFIYKKASERNDPEALKQECNIFHMMFESLIDLQKKLAEIHSKFPSDLCS